MGEGNVFEIWNEGYSVSGMKRTATTWGKATGETFKQACINFARRDGEFSKNFDPKQMTWAGRRLFDNEADARRSFG